MHAANSIEAAPLEQGRPSGMERGFRYAVAWRRQPKWVASRSLISVGPNATLIKDDMETVIRGLKAQLAEGDRNCGTSAGAKPDRARSH